MTIRAFETSVGLCLSFLGAGHNVPTGFLKCTADRHESIRDTDFIGRYGGEEFVVILPEAALKGTLRRAGDRL